MKFVLVVATVLAAAYGAHIAKQEIDKKKLLRDLLDFEALKPMHEIAQIIGQYNNVDKEFQNFVEYTTTNEFKKVFGAVIQTPEAIAVFDYLEHSGLYAHQYANLLADFSGIDPLFPQVNAASFAALESQEVTITGGLAGLAADIKKVTPFDKFEQLHDEKMKSSADYAAFINRVMAPEFNNLATKFGATKSFENLINNMVEHGVDITGLVDLSCTALGIKDCKF